jgi:hypothetical protein
VVGEISARRSTRASLRCCIARFTVIGDATALEHAAEQELRD